MKSIKIITTTILIASLFMSCASKQDYEDEAPYFEEEEDESALSDHYLSTEMTDDFLGDFSPIELDEKVALVKQMNKLAPKELNNIYLNPRDNTVEITFRYGINLTTVIFNKAERDKIKEAAEKFLADYDAKLLQRHKVNSKTAYFKSKCPLYWGVFSDSNVAYKNDYYVNYEYFNKRMYFLFHFSPSATKKGNDVYSAKTVIYFSPTQLRDFLEIMDQDYLNAQVKNLRTKAYTY